METKEMTFAVDDDREVSALLGRPRNARALLVLGHGAGAGMRHPFLEGMSARLGSLGIATFRYQFPYMERGLRRPDAAPVLRRTVRAAVDRARTVGRGLPLLAGGKSMGGRMTSLAAAEETLAGVSGLVFLGFPLHAPGKRSADRGEHLHEVRLPMLFLQGTRDRLADLALLRPLLAAVGTRATLHVVEGGDHSFHVPKRSGRTDDEALDELATAVDGWLSRMMEGTR